MTSNETDKAVSKRVKTKSNLGGGDPNDVNPSNASILIEQVLSSPING